MIQQASISPEATNQNERIVRDSVAMYLNEISTSALLTAEQERQLTRQIKAGKAEQKKSQPDNQIIADGQEAQRNMIEANLRFVFFTAKKYIGRGVSLDDLIQEGNIGLLKAVDKFDETKGFRFCTYASWWITQSIIYAITNTSRTIRVPVYMFEGIKRLTAVSRALLSELERYPTIEEIANRMNLSIKKVEEIINATSVEPISMDVTLGEDKDRSLADIIADSKAGAPEEIVNFTGLQEEIDDVLDYLSERERRIIEMRFGLINGNTYTLKEIGKELNITNERVRQIETKALMKLRQPNLRRKLKDFME